MSCGGTPYQRPQNGQQSVSLHKRPIPSLPERVPAELGQIPGQPQSHANEIKCRKTASVLTDKTVGEETPAGDLHSTGLGDVAFAPAGSDHFRQQSKAFDRHPSLARSRI